MVIKKPCGWCHVNCDEPYAGYEEPMSSSGSRKIPEVVPTVVNTTVQNHSQTESTTIPARDLTREEIMMLIQSIDPNDEAMKETRNTMLKKLASRLR